MRHIERRVGAASAPPTSWVVYYLPLWLWAALGVPDLKGHALLPLVDRTPGSRLGEGRQVIEAIAADAATAARLEIPLGTPILRLEREFRTADGRIAVVGWIDHHGGDIPVLLSRARR